LAGFKTGSIGFACLSPRRPRRTCASHGLAGDAGFLCRSSGLATSCSKSHRDESSCRRRLEQDGLHPSGPLADLNVESLNPTTSDRRRARGPAKQVCARGARPPRLIRRTSRGPRICPLRTINRWISLHLAVNRLSISAICSSSIIGICHGELGMEQSASAVFGGNCEFGFYVNTVSLEGIGPTDLVMKSCA
jgi:hypothetical protein